MSSNSTTNEGAPPKPSSNRLPPPSLNQLAARININGTTIAPTSAPRPRLAASILRTGSSASASTTDSTAVNVSGTRTGSPSLNTPPQSTTPSNDGGDSALTSEKLDKLDKLNQQDAVPEPVKKNVKVGYKNIPSLDAITQRLAKARALSIDGSAKPPEPALIEDPKTPGFPMKAPEHPLQYPWTIFHDCKAKYPYTPAPASAAIAPSVPADPPFSAAPAESMDYEAGLTVIGEFDTVESFCRYFNWLKPPSTLERNSNYHLFKSGIKPMWEDEANANGGKWVLTMKNNPVLLDRCWNWLTMALVGEELEEGDEICGAVVSLRSKVDRIQVWTRSKDEVEKLNSIGKKLVKILDISEADGIGLEFQYNTDDRPTVNKFLSIQAMPTTSYRSSFTPVGGPANPSNKPGFGGFSPITGPGEIPLGAGPPGNGAFGSFGVSIGGGPGAWRGKKL